MFVIYKHIRYNNSLFASSENIVDHLCNKITQMPFLVSSIKNIKGKPTESKVR